MTNTIDLQPETLRRLQAHAQQSGCSVDALLTRWLNAAPKLDTSHHFQEQLLHAVREAVIATDLAGRILYWNRGAEKLYGWTAAESIGRNILDITPASTSHEQAEKIFRQLARGKRWTGEFEVQRKDGSIFTAQVSDHPIVDEHGKVIGIVGTSYDITERRESERALRESEEKYRLIAENTSDGILIIDGATATVTYASPAYERQWQRNPGATIGFTAADIYEWIHPEDRDAIFADILAAINQRADTLTYTYRALNGDGSYHWKEDHAHFNYASDGTHRNTYVISRDITDRVNSASIALENERLKVRFQQEQEQNALIQQTIAALSHDLRTPLTVIATAKDILSRYFDQLSYSKRQEKLDSIGRQLQFALEVLDDTVEVVKSNLNQRVFDPVPVNLAALCRVSVEEIGALHRTPHRLHFVNPGGVEIVTVDEILVSRILLNLLSNAIKYSPDGGDIRLELQRRDDWVVLRLIDQGIGIAPQHVPHIFDPFYRADVPATISGTGLGLSIVKDCVERHQGRISVNSKPGRGTTFTVELPINATPPADH